MAPQLRTRHHGDDLTPTRRAKLTIFEILRGSGAQSIVKVTHGVEACLCHALQSHGGKNKNG